MSSNVLLSFIAIATGTFFSYLRLLVIGRIADNILYRNESENKILLNMLYLVALFVFYATIPLSAIWGLEFFVFFTIGTLMINTVTYISAILELLLSFRKSYKEGEI
jgi:hypothetical protein